MNNIFICPRTHKDLFKQKEGLNNAEGILYPYLIIDNQYSRIPNFVNSSIDDSSLASAEDYIDDSSVDKYRNFVSWLFETFNEDETEFRKSLVNRLKLSPGDKVLVTGCGLGDDIPPILDQIGLLGEVHVNDLSSKMVLSTYHRFHRTDINILYSVCDAGCLPYRDDFFDAAIHFGGINLFSDIEQSILEMERVVKVGGKVVFGDEGIAPWLKKTEYGLIAINNNNLWALESPIEFLPRNAVNVNLTWVLGNCFYLIDFEISNVGPYMNLDVKHKGSRGGTMRTRYYGQLEGVSAQSKDFVLRDAKKKKISVHEWLENFITKVKDIK